MPHLRLSDHGYSRLFTADLVARLRASGVTAFTAASLLRSPDLDLVYALRRAANLDVVLHRHERYRWRVSGGARSNPDRAKTEVSRFFARFFETETPLPTNDGVADAWACPVLPSCAWRLLGAKPTPADLKTPLSPEEATLLSDLPAEPPRSPRSRCAPADPADDPGFDPDAEWLPLDRSYGEGSTVR